MAEELGNNDLEKATGSQWPNLGQCLEIFLEVPGKTVKTHSQDDWYPGWDSTLVCPDHDQKRYHVQWPTHTTVVKVKKGEVFRVHAMRAYRWIRSTAPPVLNFSTTWKWWVNVMSRPFYPQVRTPVPEWEAGGLQNQPDSFFRISLASARPGTLDRPDHKWIAIPTMLCWFLKLSNWKVDRKRKSLRTSWIVAQTRWIMTP